MSFDKENREWLAVYEDEVVRRFREGFQRSARFQGYERLLQRFRDAMRSANQRGDSSSLSNVYPAHNELVIAQRLLDIETPRLTLEYEPVVADGKSVDFRATGDTGEIFYVDVKTISPTDRDRWDQYQRASDEGLFPENARLTLTKNRLGGELWHDLFASRSRMLEYALEFEAKIREGNLVKDRTYFVLALCGDGFAWRQSLLEDFISCYRSGSRQVGDPFAKMEADFIAQQQIVVERTITHFAHLERPKLSTSDGSLDWNVQPPRHPF